MNLEELRSVRRTERQKDSLQPLRETFYRDVADYVADLKAERERVASEADDPFSSPEVGRLTDEIESAEEVVESLYERRVGKVVKLATFAAADMSTDEDGLTHEERDLFADLVDRIRENRRVVLDTLAGEYEDEGTDPTPDPVPAADPDPDSEPAATTDTDPTPDASDVLAEAMGEEPDSSDVGPSTPDADPDDGETEADAGGDVDRTTVRITRDVGAILGVDDREYDLARDDVVTLPAANADPLVDREAAERLE